MAFISLGHAGNELENNEYLNHPLSILGIPKQGMNELSGLFTGQTKLTPSPSGLETTAPPIEDIVSPALYAPPSEADTPISKAWKLALQGLYGPVANTPQFQSFGANALKGTVGLATDPAIGLMAPEAIGAKAATGLGLGILPSMAEGAAEKLGRGISLVGDQGKSVLDPEVTGLIGSALPETAMLGMGLKHLPEQARAVGNMLPEIPLGEGYSSRSPLTFFDPGSIEAMRGELGGLPVSAMAEGGIESPNPFTETLSRPRPLYQTIAEHGKAQGESILAGRTPRPSSEGAYGQGLYLSQDEGFAPNWATNVRVGDNPIVAKGDVSAEKPLFLDEPAPRDLRMKALVELNKFKQSGAEGYSPELLEGVKAGVLHPENTPNDIATLMQPIITANIPLEQRANYTGDPISDLYKSAGYDLWRTGKQGTPAQEMVVTDPRRQFKIGETYDPRQEGSKEILSDSDVKEIIERGQLESQGQSLKNPTVRIGVPKELSPGEKYIDPSDWVQEANVAPKSINLPTVIDKAARVLGYKDLPLGSRVTGETKSPLQRFEENQTRKYGQDWENKQSPEEKAFHEQLAKNPESGKYLPVEEPQAPIPMTRAEKIKMGLGSDFEYSKDPEIRAIQEKIIKAKTPKEETLPIEEPGVEKLAEELRNRNEKIQIPGKEKPLGPKGVTGRRFKTETEKTPNEKSLADDLTDLPKTLRASMDISFPLRQGLFLMNRPEALKGMIEGSKSIYSHENHLRLNEELANRPNAELYNQFGLNQVKYDPTEISARNEQFPISAHIAEKIPGVAQSERAYTDAGNLARANMFDIFHDKWSKQGKTPDNRPDLYYGAAKYLNVLTGRDPLPKKLQAAGWILNKAFWSPMFVKSRLQMLNPVFYGKLPREVQVQAIRDVGGTLGTLATALGALSLITKNNPDDQKVKVETDPTHTDFGKARIGKTTYDLFSGLLPIIRTVSRITTGEMKTRKGDYALTGGGIVSNKEGQLPRAPFGGSTALDQIANFGEGKLSPIINATQSKLKGVGFGGEAYGWPEFLRDTTVPMAPMDIIGAWKDYDAIEGLKAVPSIFGVGVRTDIPENQLAKNAPGNNYFKAGGKKKKGTNKYF